MSIMPSMVQQLESVLLAMQEQVLALLSAQATEKESNISTIDSHFGLADGKIKGDQLSTQLALVQLALARLQDGDFGRCNVCGQTIDQGRLESFPWTPFCFECQSRIERGEADNPSRAA